MLNFFATKDPRFLLPETSVWYYGLCAEAEEKRKKDYATIQGKAVGLEMEATRLEAEAGVSVAPAGASVAAIELVRRKIPRLKQAAEALLKRAVECKKLARWLERKSRMLPGEFIEGEFLPPGKYNYPLCKEVAERKARRLEREMICNNGVQVFSEKEEHPDKTYGTERRIVRYKDRFFLCQIRTSAKEESRILFVTDSVSQMEDAELQAIENANP